MSQERSVTAPEDKEHTFEVLAGGKVHAQVHDTVDLRAAFLHYCTSSMKPSEMRLAAEGPLMSAQQFTAMARDQGLVEPEGEAQCVGQAYTCYYR